MTPLDPGVDFVEAVEEVVGAYDVLIPVIGNRWLTSSDRRGRQRLDIAEDLARLEIATAFDHECAVRLKGLFDMGRSANRFAHVVQGIEYGHKSIVATWKFFPKKLIKGVRVQ